VFKYHVSPPGSETSQSNANSQLFDSQKVAMMTDGDWDLTGLYSGAKFKVGVSPLPTGPNGRVSVMNGLSDAIYAKTEHPKEAWELVKWLASKQSQDILTKGGYVWPGINDNALSNNFVSAWKAKGIDVKPFLDEAHGTTISFPVTDKWNQANTDIEDQMKLLWLGKISAENAAKAAVKKANADLAGGNSDDGSGMGN
jgi:multiple sugar transport system substrate-binding protein